MQQSIKAFVGHSFTKEDAELVTVILKYLSRISELHTNFTWEHAENPEPTMVDVKVLALLADKNLFIGICTKKEKVIPAIALREPWYSRHLLVAKKQDFQWKTSDWIIQEIGLAVGRGLNVILLLEEGVKVPGALQGNLEYISLNRERPERCFDSLLAMITSLTPKSKIEAGTLDRPSEVSPKSAEAAASRSENWLVPNENWVMDDYENAALHHILLDKDGEFAKLSESFRASSVARAETNRTHFDAWVEYMRIIAGKSGSITVLRTLALARNAPDSWDYLGESYQHFEEYQKAGEAFDLAADLSTTSSQKAHMYGKAALAYQKANLQVRAAAAEAKMRALSKDAEGNVEVILRAELKLCELRGADEFALAAMEHLLELNPTDKETRFAIAHKYSDIGKSELALFHYLRIPYGARDAAAWNNLGVCFETSSMPIKSINAYRQSVSKGESLAISNLALRFMNAGFIGEAKDLLEGGLQISDHHKNVDLTFAKLKEATESEDETEKAAVTKAKPISEFYRNVGSALVEVLPSDVSGEWKSPNAQLSIDVTGEVFYAKGVYEVSSNLLAALSNPYLKTESSTWMVEYRGKVQGRAVLGTLSRKKLDGAQNLLPKTILGDAAPAVTFLMWLSNTGNTLNVLEQQVNSSPRLYEISRLS